MPLEIAFTPPLGDLALSSAQIEEAAVRAGIPPFDAIFHLLREALAARLAAHAPELLALLDQRAATLATAAADATLPERQAWFRAFLLDYLLRHSVAAVAHSPIAATYATSADALESGGKYALRHWVEFRGFRIRPMPHLALPGVEDQPPGEDPRIAAAVAELLAHRPYEFEECHQLLARVPKRGARGISAMQLRHPPVTMADVVEHFGGKQELAAVKERFAAWGAEYRGWPAPSKAPKAAKAAKAAKAPKAPKAPRRKQRSLFDPQ